MAVLEREYAMLTTRFKALAIEGEGDEYAKKKERREEPPTPTPWGASLHQPTSSFFWLPCRGKPL